MMRVVIRPFASGCRRGRPPPTTRRCLITTTTKAVSDPLRILFCGSDAFSCESLKALKRERDENRRLIESLEVMVLPPKRTGRGLKQLREVPCMSVAEKLGLELHQQRTFRDWQLPKGTNLIVVVSFGLFVPSRILRSAKYGGLNVHPSLLPDLRGPAPIHHALLRKDSHTGVSLQTLDDKAFDHGTILAQTPAPGIPIPPGADLGQLTHELALVGAEMLVQGLRDGAHVPPHRDTGWMARELGERELEHAPKLSKADSQVDWLGWKPDDFDRRMRIFGSLWTFGTNKKGEQKRVIILDVEVAERPADSSAALRSIPMARLAGTSSEGEGLHAQKMAVDEKDGSCFFELNNGSGWVRIRRIKVEGKSEQAAANAMQPFGEVIEEGN